uniref:Uncharacterized protein n=1 Tax=Chlamydomonas euryale TaxID=1486919 RepID=A0A7R9Z2G2_9CHLO
MADSMQPLCVHWEKVAVGVASSPQVLTLRRLAVPLFRAADAQLARLEPMRAAAVRLMQHRAMQDVRKAAHSAAAALTGLFSSEAPASAPPFAAAWGVVAAAVGGGATDAAHAWDAAAVHAAESYKAMGVLLACASADACASTGAAVRSGAAAVAATALTGAPCVESLSGRDFTGGDGAARLQTRLCAALSACPSPLVVFDSLDVADVPVVTVLINVLSEAGNLQANGDSVPAAGAAFVFPVELPDAVATAADGSGGREGFERAAKNALTARMLSGVDAAVASAHGGGVTTGEEAAAEASRVAAEVGVLVRALRRRLDVVLPVA